MNSTGFGGSGGRPLCLPDFDDERVGHVGRDGLPELEVGVPDGLSCGRSPQSPESGLRTRAVKRAVKSTQ